MRETIFLKIWHGHGEILCTECGRTEYWAVGKTVENAPNWHFNGKWATVHVISAENEITRAQAIKWATDFMKGRYNLITVDLVSCTGSIASGLERHPRQ